MFGYIVPQVSELKVREYELYRAYYCGLCKMLKQEYKKNAVLNYDSVFLYLLADGLREDQGTVEPCKCAFHPVKKRSAVITPAASYAADVNILMAYFQIEDNLRDGKKGMRLTKALFKKAFDKAACRRRGMVDVARKTIDELCVLEKERSANTDAVADSYARLLGTVFQDADVLQSHILYDLGYSIGRWVYLIDAVEDCQKDEKSGNYNVYLNKYGKLDRAAKEQIRTSLFYTLAQAAQELGRLELKRNREILQNIIYLGLRTQTEAVLENGCRMVAPVE